MKAEITRIAPSPTGLMHLGTARTAYYNWLAARASGGRFILRIDDTDASRNDEAAVAVIDDGLAWLGLGHDERFRQSDRADVYAAAAERLLTDGRAYRAENGAVLLSPGFDPSWTANDGKVMTPTDKERALADDQVLIRGDGAPVYHFASVVDDADKGVTLIIRGVDHVSNTFRQAAIFRALGAEPPRFAHVGLITQGGKKMSKRDGAASLLSYRDAGYDPDAVLNALLRMGWGPSVDDKSAAILPRERALDLFLTGGRMKPSPAGFDLAKLDWFDRKYKAMKDRAPAP